MSDQIYICYLLNLRVWCHAYLQISAIKDYKLRIEEGIPEDLDGLTFVRLQGPKASYSGWSISPILTTEDGCELGGGCGKNMDMAKSRDLLAASAWLKVRSLPGIVAV